MKQKTVKQKNTRQFKFYILQQKHWTFTYDEIRSCIIYATDPKQARTIAQHAGLDECDREHGRGNYSFWTDPRKSTCRLLTTAYQNKSTAQMVIAETFDG